MGEGGGVGLQHADLHRDETVDGQLGDFSGSGRHAANGGLRRGHAKVHFFENVAGCLAAFANQSHVRLERAVHDVALGDELGVVAQAGVNAILNEVLASPFDVARNNSAPDDNVLVGNLFGVDVHEYLPTNRGEQRAKRGACCRGGHIAEHAVVIVPLASSGRCSNKDEIAAKSM